MRRRLQRTRPSGRRARVVAIVPAAGCGRRLGLAVKKPFVMLGGRPLVVWALAALDRSRVVDAIVIAAEPSCLGRIGRLVRRYRLTKVTAIVSGGATRSRSVENALAAAGNGFDIVLIHDAARPFLDGTLIDNVVRAAGRFGAALAAVAETDTVKLIDRSHTVIRTLDRRRLWRAQTPQAFRYRLLAAAYAAGKKRAFTDDVGMIEAAGGRVKAIPGSYRNIKITTREDLRIAEVLACG